MTANWIVLGLGALGFGSGDRDTTLGLRSSFAAISISFSLVWSL